MNLGRLIWREILHRPFSFVLAMATVTVAVGCLIAVAALLGSHDLRSRTMTMEMNEEAARLESEFSAEMKAYEDSVRKNMKGLGFNVFIFPEGQELSEVYAEGFASKTMPEEYVKTLANSNIVTVNHLLPSLTRKLKWPEQNERTVILIGIRGEVPLSHRDPKKPLIDRVKKGHLVLGYELHKSMGLQEGNATTFLGREFIVQKCHPESGGKDDITLWMHLTECQELLKQEGRINAIKALECNCASIDRLGEIRREIAGILPGTKVIETKSKALARAEARNKAKKHAEEGIAAKKDETIKLKENRAKLRIENERKYAALQGVVLIATIVSVGFLAFTNARARQTEIGILRAMGTSTGSILGALMSRAFLIGFLGAAFALLIAWLLAGALQDGVLQGFDLLSLQGDAPLVLIAAPILACAASWLPAFYAVNRDPATILRND